MPDQDLRWLHNAAEQTANGVLVYLEKTEEGGACAPTFAETILSQAYLDLFEKRGLPPEFNPSRGYPSIQLVNGDFFDFLHPERTPVSPEVIASSLSKICRCTGQIAHDDIYSVAQHCCHASDVAPKPLKFFALMHDAHECVVGDVASPLKMICPDYKIVEKRVANAFAKQYDMPLDYEHRVKDIDNRMAATEKRDIMPPGEWVMLRGVEPYPFKIEPWSVRKSREEWLNRFTKLYADHLESLENV